MTEPFLISDLSQLRDKIRSFEGVWLRRWERILAEAEEEQRTVRWYGSKASDFPLHASFAHLISGERRLAAIARGDFLWMLECHAETLAVGAQDHDTWIYAAPLARRAVALDWVWDRGALNAAEQTRVADFLIGESLRYPYVVLHHRVPPHANNQGLAMALCCVVVGYLFGVKNGRDPRAIHLLEFGLPHLHQQIALLPPGGYSGEGSTYIFNVADPLMALACATLEAISGEDYFRREFWPSRNSAARVLDLDAKLIPPSGLLPAWDQHGYHMTKAGTACAYAAHRSGDPSHYSHFLFGDGWECSGHFAWMNDDRIWQLVWMPDPREVARPESGAECWPRSWAEERVAGALLDRHAEKHILQTWDISAERPARLHMNPNALLIEAWGSPLTVDGNATDGFPLDDDPRMQYLHQYSAEPKMLSWSSGSLGAHSVIAIDGALGHTSRGGGYENLPAETTTGWLLRREERPGFQLLAAEVAGFYDGGFDVRSMIRNSALIGDSFWAILDTIEAGTEHEFTWQLVLRAGAVATEYGAHLLTAEAVVLDVIHLDGAEMEFADVPGYPSLLERRCHHARKRSAGSSVEFLTLLVPQLARRELADWTPDGLADLHFSDECRIAWRCAVPAADGALLLELPRSRGLRVRIDGEALLIPETVTLRADEPPLLPVFLDVTTMLRGRDMVELELEIPPDERVGVLGKLRLHQRVDVAVPQVARQTDGSFRVRYGDVDLAFDPAELRTAPEPTPRPEPEGEDPLAAAASLLGKLPLDPDADPLRWDGDAADRARACIAAVHQPLADVEAPLLTRCEEDHEPDWLVRMLAIGTLGRLRSHAAIPALLEILRRETPERISDPAYPPKYRLKEMAVVALGEIADPATAPALADAMDHAGFYGIRRVIPGILERLGDPDSRAVLERWAQDADGETANACRRALAEEISTKPTSHALQLA